MMKPHDQLTVFRTLHRIRELRQFRDLVATYFERSERDVNDMPMDWEGAQAARSRINQMLPRVLQLVRAAGLGGQGTSPITDPGLGRALARVEVLQRIFSARQGDGLDQEIIDVLDMAVGVYEGGRVAALARTINPLHYAATALAFLARVPRRALAALGLWRPRSSRPGNADYAQIESLAARLAEAEELIDTRLAAVLDRQAVRHGEYSRQLTELAERLDFAERVLAGQEPPKRLEAPEGKIPTPV
jgi:hypothetical protein